MVREILTKNREIWVQNLEISMKKREIHEKSRNFDEKTRIANGTLLLALRSPDEKAMPGQDVYAWGGCAGAMRSKRPSPFQSPTAGVQTPAFRVPMAYTA